MRLTAPLSCLALLFTASQAGAATWHSGTTVPLAGVEADPARAALTYVDGRAAELSIEGVELRTSRIVRGAVGARVVRFQQTLDGVPVIGGGVVVRLAPDGSVGRVMVDVARDLDVDSTPTLDAAQAHAMLVDELGVSVPAAERAELVVVRIGEGRLVWELDVRDAPGGTRYWVDAHDGSLVLSRSLATHAQGSVYLDNAVETPEPTNVELPLLDTTADPIHLNGWSSGGVNLLTVTNYVSGSSMSGFEVDQQVVPSAGQDFFYPPPATMSDATDAFAQVNLYYHLTTIRSLFASLGADVDNASYKLTAVANALEGGDPLDNAFFSEMGQDGTFASPNLIAIGQGTLNDFAYDSDVFKHEFGHYVSHNAIGYNRGQANFDSLGLSPFSGSIDEGIADYFACSDNDDAELGEASLVPLGAGRTLTDTSRKCPDDMVGEVHEDGEIIGSVSWALREEFGKDVGDQLIWGAISSLPDGGDFDDFAKGIVATAEDLVASGDLQDADLATVDSVLAAQGLDNCGRIVALGAGDTSRTTIIGLDLIAQLFGTNCEGAQGFGVEIPSLFHYSWTPASGDTGLRFVADMNPLGGGGLDYTIYARANDPVTFSAAGGLPQVQQSDYNAVQTSETGELIIDASSDPPFDASATYDFVIVSRSCPTTAAELHAEAYVPPVEEGGGGAGGGAEGGGPGDGGSGGNPIADGDDEDDGCGCEVPGGTESPSSAVIALAALAFAATRRRRR